MAMGAAAVPEIRLSYRWRTAMDEPLELVGLRTPLPCDLLPGERVVVPLHVLPPAEPGRYRLDVDLVHEHVRWFGCAIPLEVDVLPRRRVAVAGGRQASEEALDALLWAPEVEPVRLRPGEPPTERFGLPQIAGLRTFLLGGPDSPVSRTATLARTARLLRAAARSRQVDTTPPEHVRFLGELDAGTALIVAGVDWDEHSPQSRELWRLAATVAAARLAGRRVLRTREIAPASASLHDRALAALVGRLAERVPEDRAAAALGGARLR